METNLIIGGALTLVSFFGVILLIVRGRAEKLRIKALNSMSVLDTENETESKDLL